MRVGFVSHMWVLFNLLLTTKHTRLKIPSNLTSPLCKPHIYTQTYACVFLYARKIRSEKGKLNQFLVKSMEVYGYPSHSLPSYSFGNLVDKAKEFFRFAVSTVIGNVFSAIFTFFFALGTYISFTQICFPDCCPGFAKCICFLTWVCKRLVLVCAFEVILL